jgi:hypothetical protein
MRSYSARVGNCWSWPRKLAGVCGGALTVAACSAGGGAPHNGAALPAVRVVAYEVEGAGGAATATVTARTPTGIEQGLVKLPLRGMDGVIGTRYTAFGPGAALGVSAQNRQARGTVTCRIKVDGRVVAQNTSAGGYAVVTCGGRL